MSKKPKISKKSKSIEEMQSQLMIELQKANKQIQVRDRIHMMIDYHLHQCLVQTGEILEEDLKYCFDLAQRIIDHSQKT